MKSREVLNVLKVSVLGALLFSCAKDKAYEPVFKEKEVVKKGLITTEATSFKTYNSILEGDKRKNPDKSYETKVGDNVYLYIPMAESGSYHSPDVFPYLQGMAKLVTFEFTKDSLVVNAMERDDRYKDNVKPIMEIPVTHVDYRCKENADKECSNIEEENDDISWRSKQYVEFDFDKIELAEFDSISGFYQELINELFRCNKTVKTSIKSWEITEDTVDIVVTRTMKKSILCSGIREMSDLENLSYAVDHHYKFKKLNSIASADYKPVLYPKDMDEDTFGFFTEEYKKLSSDNRVVSYSEKIFMSRFNPEVKDVIYHLSSELYDPKYAGILKATKEAVESINNSLKQAKAGIQIVLSDKPREEVLHDIHNSIIFVEEPFAAGPLGYGPSVKNPINGEILQAQSVMYYGNLLWTIKGAYDDLVASLEINQEKIVETVAPEEKEATPASLFQSRFERETLAELNEYVWEVKKGLEVDVSENAMAVTYNNYIFEEYLKSPFANKESMFERMNHDLRREKDRMEVFSRHNIFSGEHLNIEEMIEKITSILNVKKEKLQSWAELSDSQKESLIKLIAPKIWKATLVHEMGHNLGLRHNFNGSEDKDNFFTKEELAEMGIDQEIPYSSVMDYSKSSINDLPMMGKYDIAALKFGYARKVDMKDGSEKDLAITLKQTPGAGDIAEYAYCSDEGVSLNATCNRFDEGTNFEEIADSYIDSYKKFYKRVNFKEDRLRFSSYDNYSNFIRKYYRTFFPMRRFFDNYERIYFDFIKTGRATPDHPFIKPLVNAVTKIADFMMEIINVDDALCKVEEVQSKRALLAPLADFDITHCSQLQALIPDTYQVQGQIGELFNDMRAMNNPETYVDQIDVRGQWMDKLLAVEVLLMRDHGIKPLDTYTENFVTLGIKLSDGTSVKDAIKTYMDKLIDSKSSEVKKVKYFNGEIKKETITTDLTNSFYIPDGVDRRANSVFGLDRGHTHFVELMFESLLSSYGAFDNHRKNELSKDYLVLPYYSSELVNSSKISTKYGVYYFDQDAEAIHGIVSKIKVIEVTEGKNESVVNVLAQIRGSVTEADKMIEELDKIYQQQSAMVYQQDKATFDALAKVDIEILNSFASGNTEEIEEEILNFLKSLEINYIIAALNSAKNDATDIALHLMYAVLGHPTDDYKEVAKTFAEVKDEKVLKSLTSGTLNSKEHYEKIISALAQSGR